MLQIRPIEGNPGGFWIPLREFRTPGTRILVFVSGT